MRAPASGFGAPNSSRSAMRPGHLVLGEPELVPTGLGEREVGDLEGEGVVAASVVMRPFSQALLAAELV